MVVGLGTGLIMQHMPYHTDSVSGQRRQYMVIAHHWVCNVAESELALGEMKPGGGILGPEAG